MCPILLFVDYGHTLSFTIATVIVKQQVPDPKPDQTIKTLLKMVGSDLAKQ
jgi:hypothetical protein